MEESPDLSGDACIIAKFNATSKWTVCQTGHCRKTLRHGMAPRDSAGMTQHKRNAHARITAPAKQSTIGATFGNIWRPYHETGETAAPRYSLKCLHLARNSKLHLTPNSGHHLAAHSRLRLAAHGKLHLAAWQLATFSGTSCNDKDTLSQTILYINCAYQISGAYGSAGQ